MVIVQSGQCQIHWFPTCPSWDITECIDYSKIKLFAKDACLYLSFNNKLNVANKINEDLKNIELW